MEKQRIVDAHNKVRQMIALGKIPGQPAATNMKEMIWDSELAVIAQRWADQCMPGHDHRRNVGEGGGEGGSWWPTLYSTVLTPRQVRGGSERRHHLELWQDPAQQRQAGVWAARDGLVRGGDEVPVESQGYRAFQLQDGHRALHSGQSPLLSSSLPHSLTPVLSWSGPTPTWSAVATPTTMTTREATASCTSATTGRGETWWEDLW